MLDSQIFEMLDREALSRLNCAHLELELLRVHRMLDRVADYQRVVLHALGRAESVARAKSATA
jgi:hypothetical protein